MRSSEVTIPQLLKKSGYATCHSGKWHCNGKFNSPAQPQPDSAGFDHWFGTQNNASPSHENPKNFVRNGEAVGPMEGFSCQLVVDEAVTWLKQQQKADPKQPFFLYVAFHEPHEPVASPKELVDQYLPEAKNENEAQYFANVANVDDAVGRLMASLKKIEGGRQHVGYFYFGQWPRNVKAIQSSQEFLRSCNSAAWHEAVDY